MKALLEWLGLRRPSERTLADGGTFCVACRVHLPLDEFVWKGTREQVGS